MQSTHVKYDGAKDGDKLHYGYVSDENEIRHRKRRHKNTRAVQT